jgi:hypothetical protein
VLHLLLTFWLASCTADAVTTHRGLDSGRMVEVDPLMPAHKWTIDAVLLAQATGGVILVTKGPKRHHKLIVAGILAGSLLHTYAAIHNERVYLAVTVLP